MIPGIVSKLSEVAISLTDTIIQKTDIVRVNSTATTTVLVTITTLFPGQGGLLLVINDSGNAITATTAGNISTTCSIANKTVGVFVYSPSAAKWFLDKTL